MGSASNPGGGATPAWAQPRTPLLHRPVNSPSAPPIERGPDGTPLGTGRPGPCGRPPGTDRERGLALHDFFIFFWPPRRKRPGPPGPHARSVGLHPPPAARFPRRGRRVRRGPLGFSGPRRRRRRPAPRRPPWRRRRRSSLTLNRSRSSSGSGLYARTLWKRTMALMGTAQRTGGGGGTVETETDGAVGGGGTERTPRSLRLPFRAPPRPPRRQRHSPRGRTARLWKYISGTRQAADARACRCGRRPRGSSTRAATPS